MVYLFIVSILWAFSFGLIKNNLTSLDSNLVSSIRMGISFLVFVPFLRIRKLNKKQIGELFLIGMVQYGVMYITYIYSYQFLKAYEVAFFTIFTPLFVTFFNDIFTNKFHLLYLISALIAVVGTGLIIYQDISDSNILFGILLVQISNISFAFGQIYYKKVISTIRVKEWEVFGVLYLGGFFLTALFMLSSTDFSNLNIELSQIFILIYLGVVASGVGFFLWNYGTMRTNAGALAVFNNFKIPLAIIVSILLFGEEAKILNVVLGTIIVIIALFLNEHFSKKNR
ncbi:EamA family transporter [Bacteroidota bacterium]